MIKKVRAFNDKRFHLSLLVLCVAFLLGVFQNCSGGFKGSAESTSTNASSNASTNANQCPGPSIVNPDVTCSSSNCDVWISAPADLSKLATGDLGTPDPSVEANFVGARFCLSQDIDFTGINPQSIGKAISSGSLLNGCGHKIINLSLTTGGLFHTLEATLIENLIIDSPVVNISIPMNLDPHGNPSATIVGLMADGADDAVFHNVQITKMHNPSFLITGNVGQPGCGILAGMASNVQVDGVTISGDDLTVKSCGIFGGLFGALHVDPDGSSTTNFVVNNVNISFSSMNFDQFQIVGGAIGNFDSDTVSVYPTGTFSNVSVSSDIQAGNSTKCAVNESMACAAVGGVFGAGSPGGLQPFAFSNISYSGNLHTIGVARGTSSWNGLTTHFGGVGGLVGTFWDSLTFSQPAIQGACVSGTITVDPSAVNSPTDLIGGIAVGGIWASSAVNVPNQAISATLTVNGALSTLITGMDDSIGAAACVMAGQTIPAGSAQMRYYNSSVGTNSPAACTYGAAQCWNGFVNFIGVYGNIDYANYKSSVGPTSSMQAQYLSGQETPTRAATISNFPSAGIPNSELLSFVTWLYGQTTSTCTP